MKIIGHRGAASLAPENSIRGIHAAIEAGVDGVEFDVRLSKDRRLYLCHDPTLVRTHDVDEYIGNLTSDELDKIMGPNGDHVPTLDEALRTADKTPVYIEAKARGWAKLLAEVVAKHPNKKLMTVISFNHQTLAEFKKHCPDVPVYVLEHRNPFDAINAARVYGFDGIDINYWTMNPLVYLLAKRHNLGIIVYTADKPWLIKVFRRLYPNISVTTNSPQKLKSWKGRAE